MKTKVSLIRCLLGAMLFATIISSQSAPTLVLSDGDTTLTIVDGSPEDLSPIPGVVMYDGPVGPSFFLNITTGQSDPVIGNPTEPQMHLDELTVSGDGGTISILFSDDNFGPTVQPQFTSRIGGITDGSVSFNTYINGSPLASFGPFGPGGFSDSSTTTRPSQASYTLAMETTITHFGPGELTGFNAEILTKECPEVSCPPDKTIECGESTDPSQTGAPSADCCILASAYTDSDPIVTGQCVSVIIRTWTVTTSCEIKTCMQTITIVDTTNPVISGVGLNFTVQCPATPVFSDPTVSDTCGTATLSYADSTTQLECPGNYSVTRTWTATDGCNTTTASQTITVEDTTAPVISGVGADATIQCPGVPVFGEPTTSDSCGTATMSFADVTTALECPGKYKITRTWTATDGCNTTTASQTITVEDNTPPTITSAGPNATIDCGAEPNFTPPTANDTCDSNPQIVLVSDVTTPSAGGGYTRTKTWKAVDACGNFSTTVSQSITVPGGVCDPATFVLDQGGSGNSSARTFTANGVNVQVTAFSRDASGNWAAATIGQYSGSGLGVIDSSGSDSTSPHHAVDNVGRNNYLLFQFSKPVVVSGAYLGWVSGDSDFSIRIRSGGSPIATLNQAIFDSFTYAEENDTTLTGARSATFNAGAFIGDALIIAASLTDTTPDDFFKLKKLDICVPGCFEPVSVGDFVWNDLDKDGIQDAGEPGINGVKLNLTGTKQSGGSVSLTTTTAGNGGYLFGNLSPGTYQVTVDAVNFASGGALAGFTASPTLVGANRAVDSNPSPSGTTPALLPGGSSDLTLDFGFYPTPPPPEEECVPATFDFSGSSSLNGTDGNVRTFSANGTTVNVTAFSRTSGGTWAKAFLGSYGGGLGVTDSGEGDGGGNKHTVDNIDRVNYVLFQFSQDVVVNKAFLGYVVGDSDISVWVGSSGSITTLSDAVLSGLGTREDNDTTSGTTRWAAFNGSEKVGNVLVIAASLSDTTPDDQFKIEKLTICAESATPPCPSPWNSKDIGDCTKPGSASYNGGVFTIKGSGADIWNNSDSFHYAYQSAYGNCAIVARVTGVENTNPWAKAGVMIRETLNGNSEHASLFVTPGNGVAFQYRDSTGGASGNVNTTGLSAPHWVAVIRDGNKFTAYRSATGASNSWVEVGSKWITMGSQVYIGIATTSHDNSELCTATFDYVSGTP